MLQDKTRSRLFLKDRRTEFIETKELKDPLAVEVEHSQIIGLVQTALDSLKMPAVDCGAYTGEASCRIACDRSGAPKPLLEKSVPEYIVSGRVDKPVCVPKTLSALMR